MLSRSLHLNARMQRGLWRSLALGGRSFSSAADTVNVRVTEAEETTAKALRRIGWDESDAKLQASIMVSAELCGNNQGLVKMFDPKLMAPAEARVVILALRETHSSNSLTPSQAPGADKPIIERETPASAAVNARQAPGMLAAVTAADLAADKAETGGIAIVSAYNTSTSSGQGTPGGFTVTSPLPGRVDERHLTRRETRLLS